MKSLITGAAGFIGSELCLKLLERGDEVLGIDNHNDYYNPEIKEMRLARHLNHENYSHMRIDISDMQALDNAFSFYKPQRVVNLAAQAGVRYSIKNPHAYMSSNIVGFLNVLECCSRHNIEHLVYASSSSVYGANTSMPFSVIDNVDHPLSVYAASKKSNELMAHAYSHLHGLSTTGLRFFTVYGPWGRPDMAPIKFAKAILEGKTVQVFNHGRHRRDFTYIDDIIDGIIRIFDKPAIGNKAWDGKNPDPSSSVAPWRVYNIGNNNPIELMDFIRALEKYLDKKANIQLLPLQNGDVTDTHADISKLRQEFGYNPKTDLEDGMKRFVDWFINFSE
jgi:UDP-glucuronate 4-epimerase